MVSVTIRRESAVDHVRLRQSTIGQRLKVFTTDTVVAVGVLRATAAAPAAAQDGGGNGNPYYDCPNGYTVASSNITRNGAIVGKVELRWSLACGDNWTRTTSHANPYSNLQYDPWNGISAWATDTASASWSPYLVISPTAPARPAWRLGAACTLSWPGPTMPIRHRRLRRT